MGKPLLDPLALRGADMLSMAAPTAAAKDRSLSHFSSANQNQQKEPPPFAKTMGPICNWAHLAADDSDQKISPRATHTANEKPLAGSTVTRSNFHLKRKRPAVQRA